MKPIMLSFELPGLALREPTVRQAGIEMFGHDSVLPGSPGAGHFTVKSGCTCMFDGSSV
jgi:hypothetical protein